MSRSGFVRRTACGLLVCLAFVVLAPGAVYVWEVSRSNRELERPFRQEGPVALRKFPYPYRAGLAISSDIDNTESVEELVEIMTFLNTTEATGIGKGVGLEVGNSFFFWEPPGEAISYFLSDDVTRSTIRKLMRSGHIDVMHSYGKKHDFVREDAIRALRELEEQDCRVDVWVDHYRTLDNFGDDVTRGEGDHPGSPAYHADLTLAYGIRFVWMGRVTMIAGQAAPVGLRNYLYLLERDHPLASFRNMRKELAKSLLGVLGSRKYSIHGTNDLLKISELDDGQRVHEFVRYDNSPRGVAENGDILGLARSLSKRSLERLKAVRGYMIVYTHLGQNRSYGYIPEETEEALRHLAAEVRAGNIYVTTTSKLLNYYVASRFLVWSYRRVGDRTIIDIQGIDDPIFGRTAPGPERLQGITFYVPEQGETSVFIDGRAIEDLERNGPDDSGRESVSIPMRANRYPLL